MGKKTKNPDKRRVGRPAKEKCVKSIPDTPKNVAKALFGIKSTHHRRASAAKKAKA